MSRTGMPSGHQLKRQQSGASLTLDSGVTSNMRSLHVASLAALILCARCSIEIQISSVPALPFDTSTAVSSADQLLRRSCPEEVDPEWTPSPPQIIMSSFADFGEPDVIPTNGTNKVYSSSDGFVRGAIAAWAEHQHLVLRPDEIWFEVLAQLNFYMTAHAEDIRHLFVSGQGKEEIRFLPYSWHDVIAAYGHEIQKRVKTDWLLEWIIPDFTTSTENNGMTATVLMMGLMQHYFEFTGGIICGIPKVTLLGERDDWAKLLAKLNHLEDWGKEPRAYARDLRPIFQSFLRTWDAPDSAETRSFWSQIVRANKHFSCGHGAIEWDISGWITGFLHWRKDGTLRVHPDYAPEPGSPGTTTLGNVTYAPEELDQIPVGYARAPLKMLDFPQTGTDTEAYLLAGNIALKQAQEADEYVSLQPLSAWLLYAPARWETKPAIWHGSSQELEDIATWASNCSTT